jgi:carboxymethylenebutenolidase
MSGPTIDPTQATALELNRGAFVGIVAAATASPMASANPPMVPEDDPSIVVERVKLRRIEAEIDSYAAWPANARGNTPSVVVVQHAWGVDASIRDIVRRFAKAGFAAIAPNLYARLGAPNGDGVTDIDVFRPFMKQLDRKQYDGDLRAAALWLQTKIPNTKIGIVGFCMGGHIVLIQAIDNGDIFAAACPFYGSIKDIDAEKIHIPVCGSYGARDTGIDADEIRAWRAELRVPNEVRIYNTAGHAFMDTTRASYVPAAAVEAWKTTIAFLQQYLGAK